MSVHTMAAPRNSDWIPTFKGGRFYPLDPRVEDVHIEDIAHALSLTCRFRGHCREFYSVAQHSVLVAETVADSLDAASDKGSPSMIRAEIKRGTIRWALLHDAPEAYLNDAPLPLKNTELFGERYLKAEHRLMHVIAERFCLIGEMPDVVKWADGMLARTEMRDLLSAHTDERFYQEFDPLPERIVAWTPEQAESMFLNVFASGLTEVRHV